MDILHFLHKNGCEWNSTTCHSAAEGGSLECLKYPKKHNAAGEEFLKSF